jgi:hypothetical protein
VVIARVDSEGRFAVVAQAPHGVDPDPYLVNHASDELSLRGVALGDVVG